MPPIVLTAGEPAGVGPDLCLDALYGDCPRPLVVVGDRDILAARADLLNYRAFDEVIGDYSPATGMPADNKRAVWHCAATATVAIGKPSAKNASHVLRQLQWAATACRDRQFAALLTAPVSKQSILAAGIDFIGQTETIAEYSGAARSVMLLAGPRLRAALATTHLPLRQVADSLDIESLVETLHILDKGLRQFFMTDAERAPRINVCGLNPHAGEGGYLGDEEQRIILPALARAQADGIHADGPLSADTGIAASLLPATDCVLAMYHDQALPAIKLLDFDQTVNATLGLPFLRVSPAHGIAADLAGQGRVRPHSMRAALNLALSQTTA